MLAKERLAIVSICAYAPDRYRMVVDAVHAGIRGIWCEKAFATSLDEAEAMVAALKIELAIQESHLDGGSRVYLPLQERSLRMVSR